MATNTEFMDNFIDSIPLTVSGKRVTKISPPKRVCDYYFKPPFNDWRLYMSNYYLYLPYVGVITLDAERYINHQLNIDLIFDIRTGNLKYNLLSDGTLMESHEGSIRVNFPVTSASPYASASHKIASVEQAIGGVVGVASGNYTQITSVATGVINAVKPAPKKPTGGFTSGTAVNDSLHIYLLVETPEIYVDENLINNYGRPCNIWSTIGSHTGYIQIDDIRLTGDIPADDKEEILATLKSGVYLV